MGLFGRLFGVPRPERFASLLIRAIREAGEPLELRHDVAGGRILRFRDGKQVGEINLDNLYRTYSEAPRAARLAHLRACVRMALTHLKQLPADFDAARPDLRPKLWARAAFEQQRLRGLVEGTGGDPAAMPSEPVGEHLLAGLAYDWPESVQSVAAVDLGRWGVTFYEAMEAARQNLAEATPGYTKIGDHLYAFVSGDTYDATRLLLVDRIEGLEVPGRLVAMVPNRDCLLVTGSEDEAGLGMMAALAEKALEEGYPHSAVPLIHNDDGWEDWMPPPGHAHCRLFRELELGWIGPLYVTQKALLDAVHAKQGVELSVVSYTAAEKPGGERVSCCVWGEGVDALLPVAQKVALMRMGRDRLVALGDWERVREVAGALMEETEHYPPRYRVRGFPDEAALEAIGVGEL